MTPGEQADEDAIDHILLANNDFPDFLAHPIDLSGGDLKSRIQLHALYDSAARPTRRLCQMGVSRAGLARPGASPPPSRITPPIDVDYVDYDGRRYIVSF